jgi:propionyl-CoA synthetase
MNTSPATDNKFGEVPSIKEHQTKKVRFPMNNSSPYADLYNWSVTDPTSFWQAQAEAIHWKTPFHTVCDSTNPPFARWFVGGKTNLCYNAVDRHLESRANQPAIFFHSSELGTEKVITYRQLHHEVTRFAAVLKMLGINKGDRVVVYLPMIPEAAYAMLACARIGAIHSVVFAGFAASSLATRIVDAQAKLVITADAAMRAGKIVPLKKLVDGALMQSETPVEHVLIIHRGIEADIELYAERDLLYGDLVREVRGGQAEPEWLESNETSYILYTSGTTAKPKGVQRDVGGYAVALASSINHIFGGQPGETFFCTADIGWVVGHSYLIYAPLLCGMTTVIYEGVPTRPDPGIWWSLAEKYQATVMFSSPTAIRLLRKQDPKYVRQHDLSCLRSLFLAGEPLDESTSNWIRDALGVPVIDNYWQTESGWPILALPSSAPRNEIKPGSPGLPCFGYRATIVDPETGEDLPRGQKGVMACELPLPPGCLSKIWQNDQLFKKHYFQEIPGRHLFSTFDYAEQDEDGYYFILGRTDDVINVAGHRIGTREIEEAINSHADIAESAAIGAYDEIKGQAIHCFAVVRQGTAKEEPELKKETLQIILRHLGPIARPAAIHFVNLLPRTRSGKILRRAIQAVVEGKHLGDLSTLEDYIAIEGLKSVLAEARLQELRNEVRNRAFAIWMGRVERGESYFGDQQSDWLTARNELGIPTDRLL